MDDAGIMADFTSPMAATPAGRDNTPEPTAPLIKLNDAIGIEQELSLSDSLLSDDAFTCTRALPLFFLLPSPPRIFVVDSALVAGEKALDVVTTAATRKKMLVNFMLQSLPICSICTNSYQRIMNGTVGVTNEWRLPRLGARAC